MNRLFLVAILLTFTMSNFARGEAVPTNPFTQFTGVATPAPPPTEGAYQAACQADTQAVNTAGEKCLARAKFARTVCFESTNKDIAAALPIISMLLNAAQGMANSCSKMGEALKVANAALTAYSVACSAAKVACDTACSGAKTAVSQSVSHSPTSCTTASLQNPQREINTLASECEGHTQRLAAAGIGIMSMIAESKKTNECDKKTEVVDCKLTPTDKSCLTQVDCTLAENQTKPECICAKSPNTAGCPASSMAGGGDSNFQQSSAGSDSGNKAVLPGQIDSSGFGDNSISPSSGTPAGASAALGAGGSGSGGVGDVNSQKASKAADGAKGLNANILSGYEGGGGGGGGRGSSGSGSGSEYGQYMPGGKNDPSRSLASQVLGKGEVTGGGGKSNWEKIRDRYQDNRPNLLNGP